MKNLSKKTVSLQLLTLACIASLQFASSSLLAQTKTVSTSPGAAESSNLQRAREAFSQDKHSVAVLHLENHLKEFVGDDDARLLLSRAQLAAGKAEASLATANEILARSPNSTDALLYRGLASRRLNRTDQAKADFQRVIQISPAYCDAHYALISLHLLDGETSAASAALESIPVACKDESSTESQNAFKHLTRRVQIAVNPSLGCDENWWRDRGPEPREEEDARLSQARALLAKDDVKGAEKLVDEVLKDLAENSDATVLKARIEILRGKDSDAENRLEAVLNRGAAYSDCEARLLLAQARLNQRDSAGAKSAIIDCAYCLSLPDAEPILKRIDTASSETMSQNNLSDDAVNTDSKPSGSPKQSSSKSRTRR